MPSSFAKRLHAIRRRARNRLGEVEALALLRLAEVRRVEQLLEADDLRAARRRLANARDRRGDGRRRVVARGVLDDADGEWRVCHGQNVSAKSERGAKRRSERTPRLRSAPITTSLTFVPVSRRGISAFAARSAAFDSCDASACAGIAATAAIARHVDASTTAPAASVAPSRPSVPAASSVMPAPLRPAPSSTRAAASASSWQRPPPPALAPRPRERDRRLAAPDDAALCVRRQRARRAACRAIASPARAASPPVASAITSAVEPFARARRRDAVERPCGCCRSRAR